jgi:hypothetical protein
VHVASGAEVAAGAADDDRLHVIGVFQVSEQVAQLGIRIEGERILALGPVEHDAADAVGDAPGEVPGLVAGGGTGVAGSERRIDPRCALVVHVSFLRRPVRS